ncbi:MAG: hypothetical protein C0425_04390 [Chlorobiaceae bacterium]|nr:hypothetical protein [Chlorobiaceae bacterium]MBA4309556.1 hypothetical protein [Chlorobiaceae bacterium]
MKLITIIITLLFCSNAVLTQELELIGPPGGFVRSIGINPLNPNTIYTGQSGLFERSYDGGENGYPIFNNFQNQSVHQIVIPDTDTNIIFASISSGAIKSSNRGKDWESIHQSSAHLFDIQFKLNPLNNDIIYMNVEGRELWRSNNRGKDWFLLYQFEYISMGLRLRSFDIAKTDTSIMYAGSGGKIYKSTNSGSNWFMTHDNSVSHGTIREIKINPQNPNSFYFIRSSYSLMKSEDGGKTFNYLDAFLKYQLHPSDTLILYGTISLPYPTGKLVKSIDGGNTWFSIVNDIGLNRIVPSELYINEKEPEIIFLGLSGLGVFKSTNGGNNWNKTRFTNTNSIYKVIEDINNPGSYLSLQAGWGILRTSNNGKEWLQPVFHPPGIFQSSLCYMSDISYDPSNKRRALLAGNIGLFETTDGGENWYYLDKLPYVHSVMFHPQNENIVVAASSSAFIWSAWLHRSTDSGDNWYIVEDFGGFIYGVDRLYSDFNNSNIFYAVGSMKILRSTDAGETWELRVNGIATDSDGNVNGLVDIAVSQYNSELLYCIQRPFSSSIGGRTGNLYKSTNSGLNWVKIDSVLKLYDESLNYRSIWLDPDKPGRLYVGLYDNHDVPSSIYSKDGGLFLTEDDGKSWRKVYADRIYDSGIYSDSNNPRNIFLTTRYGIMKFVDTLIVTSVNSNIELEQPTYYQLSQNYPNPFNPVTTINYQIPADGYVTLKVYDVLGKEVALLEKQHRTAGSYTLNFDASNLSSGLYIYEIRVNDFVQQRKMMVLK